MPHAVGMNRAPLYLTALAIAVGNAGCHQHSSHVDKKSVAIQARFGHAKISWLIDRTLKGDEVTCGYESDVPYHPRPFIVRSGRVWQEADLPTGQFDKWQDRFCGPDWVKPLTMPQPPS